MTDIHKCHHCGLEVVNATIFQQHLEYHKGKSLPDIKALVERLHESIKWFRHEMEDKAWNKAEMYDYFRDAEEAADALEEMEKSLKAADIYADVEIRRLQAELAEEKRKLTVADELLKHWQGRLSLESLKFEAAREVAIMNWVMWCREYEQASSQRPLSPPGLEKESQDAVDAAIESKLKEKASNEPRP